MKLTRELAFARLRRKARNFGGDIRHVTEPEFRAMRIDSAPFTKWSLGVHPRAKQVIFTDCCKPSCVELFAIGLIHEMGHVFATTRHPRNADEVDWLGWEMAMARKIGLTDVQFCRGHYDYVILTDDATELGEYSSRPAARKRYFEQRIEVAKELGLIQRGHPRSVRR